MAATFDDLKQALAQNLESRGVLGTIKAKLRAEIFKSLHEDVEMPAHAFETNVLNELILEYLDFHGFKNTISVLNAEANIKKPLLPRTRTDVASDLHVDDRAFPTDIPLLYGLCFKNLPPEPIPNRVIEPTSILKRNSHGIGASDSDFEKSPENRKPRWERDRWMNNNQEEREGKNKSVNGAGDFDSEFEMGYVEVTNAKKVEKGVGP
ncbi:hypothetical protein BDR26DRAFT_859308 [Obelidium mucronatum]|nr:hypothetical protein BDR26DRAFT_859308 [Obelidium mucronatum]